MYSKPDTEDVGIEGEGEEIEILNPLEMMTEGNWSTIHNLQASNASTIHASGFVHPQHDLFARTYDIMLMKLARPASPDRPLVKINTDSQFPEKQPGGKNEITIIGMGNIEITGFWPKPDLLKQVHVDYLPYEECIDATNQNLDYKFELLPHMICTLGAGIYGNRGQCYGDSGGPYIVTGNDIDGSSDVQVGVVSWAVNCAESGLPMVGSRTSEALHFLKEVTCSMSSNPPDYLCAEENNNVADDLTGMQGRLIPDGAKVSVRIFSDPFGHEIRWKITDLLDDNKIYGEAPFGKIVGDHSFQDVIVPVGTNLKFKIDDAADDGIFGDADAILYEVVMVGSGGELVMVEGNGQFGTSREETFNVPKVNDEYLAQLRAAKADDRDFVSVSGPTAPFKIYIEFADYHEDASWKVTSADGSKTFASRNANEYRYGNDVTEQVDLAAGEYKFTISDRRGTDEFRAFNSYKLSYLNRKMQQNGLGEVETIVFQSEGLFNGEQSSHVFVIPEDVVTGGSSFSPEVIIEDAGLLEVSAGKVEDSDLLQEGTVDICRKYKESCQDNEHCCSEKCGIHGLCLPTDEEKATTLDKRDQYRTSVRPDGVGGAGRGN